MLIYLWRPMYWIMTLHTKVKMECFIFKMTIASQMKMITKAMKNKNFKRTINHQEVLIPRSITMTTLTMMMIPLVMMYQAKEVAFKQTVTRDLWWIGTRLLIRKWLMSVSTWVMVMITMKRVMLIFQMKKLKDRQRRRCRVCHTNKNFKLLLSWWQR